ncbi:ATP-dependent helicase [Thalassobaculum litoreum]|uniref:DNA 3'-5' helicase n=1 Tax=Thalassobaculum litoreum DSM 18839 TaxID=1123362 RepID=A0A8G2BG31_9PROT|nr:ATP-dependent helicase [Thalassobaculum litoreum]SDF50010.1 DNA helicase-2 / ATP-dependent DNA helicase PcrA [Thalassobaculum litoreum DSM 18839]
MSELSSAISELTEAQTAAVNWVDGPLFVLAGPGSGKTRVLTTRVAKLLAKSPEKSFRVMALTFTNKAADEMATRIEAFVPEQQHRAKVGTFHSFCMQMLQQHGSHIGINPDFAIYSLQSDRVDLLRDAIRESGLNSDDDRFLSAIDKLKARLIQPEGSAKRFRDSASGERIEQVFRAYEAALSRANALDFGSLIAQAYRLISTYPGVAVHYRRTYAYWMFDEFQDTTDGQYRLIKALAGDSFRNIVAVADDDQIIYQWNGASFQQIQRFRADFQPTEIQLPTNYRCPPSIVAAANQLVVNNTQRTMSKKPLEAGKTTLLYPDGQHIRLTRYSSEEEETIGVATEISKIETSQLGEVSVLARTRALLERMLKGLADADVPAAIAQRRDNFRSPQFLWLSSALRLAARPLDRRALDALTGAFNRWFDTAILSDDVASAAEISSRSLLSEWAASVSSVGGERVEALASIAMRLSSHPSTFRDAITNSLEQFLQESAEDSSDLEEDRAAWTALVRSIGQSIGRDAQLEQFLQELALRSKEPPVVPNTVTLMTIHSAKGKEFDHVYVIGLAEDVLPSFQSVKAGEQSPEMEEERRNCFVAITRARERLCLSYADRYRGWAKKPSRFLQEMGLDLPHTPVS